MSWQDYIDQQLLCVLPSGGQLAHAAIVGTDGSVWAESNGFPAITEQEIAAIVKGFDDPSQLAQVAAHRLSPPDFAAQSHMFIRTSGNHLDSC
jgi:hypothetical protein